MMNIPWKSLLCFSCATAAFHFCLQFLNQQLLGKKTPEDISALIEEKRRRDMRSDVRSQFWADFRTYSHVLPRVASLYLVFDLCTLIAEHSRREPAQKLAAHIFGQWVSNESNQASSHPEMSARSCLLSPAVLPSSNLHRSGQYH